MSTMNLLIGSNNRGKLAEIAESLTQLPIRLLTPEQAGVAGDPAETGASYAENALIKARFFYEASNLPTVADDSGIVVEALQGELGVHTRRWGAGPTASDEEWITYFLERMRREPHRRARFICTLAYIDDSGAEHLFEGVCEGHITETLEAGYLPGLPISACFKPDGFEAVYSALTVEQKNSTSHRGRALSQLRRFLTRNATR